MGLQFYFKTHASVLTSWTAVSLRENNGPLKVLHSQSQTAISTELMLAI
jgi:hypothetical protein